MDFVNALCEQFSLKKYQAENIIALLDEGK